MKKTLFAICFLASLACVGWAQDFALPEVKNNVESVQSAFAALLDNAAQMGIVEYDSAYVGNTTRYKQHLDNVLANMSYEKVKAYVGIVRSNIDKIDTQAISKRQFDEFERFLQNAYPYSDHGISGTYEFPDSIKLDYDRSNLIQFDEQMKQNEQKLGEYKKELANTPTVEELRARLSAIESELAKPETKKDKKAVQQLKNEDAQISKRLSSVYMTRDNLTKNIRTLEARLEDGARSRAQLVENLEKPARANYIKSVRDAINNFYSWENYFAGQNTCIHDFFVLKNTKQNLYSLLDEIPQNQSAAYKIKLDAFCAGWGL